MSYILEALKKAEAERHAGAVSALPRALFPGEGRHRPAWRKPWPWALLTVLAAILGGAAWFGTRTPTAPAALPIPAPVAIAVKEEEKPREQAAKKPPEKKTAPSEPKPVPSEAPLLALHELPEHIQREIPTLSIGGYIYSGNKADRSVLIGKRLLHEGEQIAPDLTLEKLTQRGMVLNYKGYRYRAGY
jgi:general secretion pathway protein B